MKIFDFTTNEKIVLKGKLPDLKDKPIIIICKSSEICELATTFGFDDNSILECMSYDEDIRFLSYADYDFISFMYFAMQDKRLVFHELNVFASENFLIIVLPEDNERSYFASLEQLLDEKFELAKDQSNGVVRMYYYLFDRILSDFSTTLEQIEDEIKSIENKLIEKVSEEYFFEAYRIKEMIYMIKKILRASLYIGDQFIVNESKIIPPDHIKHFRNIDLRINKLYDFAISLQEFGNQLINLYESRVAMKTNEIVNKLTVFTIFFGPLTVITGIYGMNFTHMPELGFVFGYPMALCIMLGISLGIYFVLKKKKWI